VSSAAARNSRSASAVIRRVRRNLTERN
jgi:hypothetical protein